MLSTTKLNTVCQETKADVGQLADHLSRGGLKKKDAISAIKNWRKGLFKPEPGKEDIRRLATALGVEENELSSWTSSYRWAPFSDRKGRLVTELIVGRRVQDALDVLKFTNKRAAEATEKVLKSAIANADEQQADVDNLYVSEARVDDGGIRVGTKRWIPKDRGRAHPIGKRACHIYVTVTEA
jgi:large subunit ribosomal protein L22